MHPSLAMRVPRPVWQGLVVGKCLLPCFHDQDSAFLPRGSLLTGLTLKVTLLQGQCSWT